MKPSKRNQKAAREAKRAYECLDVELDKFFSGGTKYPDPAAARQGFSDAVDRAILESRKRK